MSTNRTEHLNLHTWVGTDPVMMEEFNENFATLDASMRLQVQTYVGTGEYGHQNPTVLRFDFTPKLVLLHSAQRTGSVANDGMQPTVIYWGVNQEIYPDYYDSQSRAFLTFGEKELSIYNNTRASAQFNQESITYVCCAFG